MGAGRPQIRCCGLLQEGKEEKHTHPDCGNEQGQGEQLKRMGAEGHRRRERLGERGQSTFQPLWGRVRSFCSVCVSPGTALLPVLGTAGMCNYGSKERGSQPGSASPAQPQPLQSKGSSEERDTHRGRARSQVPVPKISPAACQQSSVISIQKKTNSGLTPGTDKLPGC